MLANTIVVALALFLPLAGYILIGNLMPVTTRLASEPEISVFLSLSATRVDAESLAPALRAMPGVDRLRFVSREEALARVEKQTGSTGIIAVLNKNPLPDAWIVGVKPERLANADSHAATLAAIEALAARMKLLPQVDIVKIDSDWVGRSDALVRFSRWTLVIAGCVLGIAVVAVVFNTIRLQAWAHRDEVDLMRLIGATESFVRRPYTLLGIALGFAGGCLALCVVSVGLILLNRAIAELSSSVAPGFRFALLSLPDLAVFVVIASLLGWLGARLSFARHARGESF